MRPTIFLGLACIVGLATLILVRSVLFSAGCPGHPRSVAARAKMREIESKLHTYRMLAGRYPTTEQGLAALAERPLTAPAPKRWTQLFRRIPTDPWGRPYHYRVIPASDTETIVIWTEGNDPKDKSDDLELHWTIETPRP